MQNESRAIALRATVWVYVLQSNPKSSLHAYLLQSAVANLAAVFITRLSFSPRRTQLTSRQHFQEHQSVR